VYDVEFIRSPYDKANTCASLKPTYKVKFTFDVDKCDRMFDGLLRQGKLKIPHTMPLLHKIKKRAYCKFHHSYLMIPMITILFIDKYNHPVMKIV
jgi:hypothetical protein